MKYPSSTFLLNLANECFDVLLEVRQGCHRALPPIIPSEMKESAPQQFGGFVRALSTRGVSVLFRETRCLCISVDRVCEVGLTIKAFIEDRDLVDGQLFVGDFFHGVSREWGSQKTSRMILFELKR